MATARFRRGDTAVLVVDMQAKLVEPTFNAEAVVHRAGLLLDGATALSVPIVATEQYPQGLGATLDELTAKMPPDTTAYPKSHFSACIDPVREHLTSLHTHTVLVCGVETHVCVLQTCLDLVDRGFVVGLVVDAVGSRRETDHLPAVVRMTQSGVVPTTAEAALFELVGKADSSQFKSILPLIK